MKTKLIIIGGRGTALNIAENISDAINKYGSPLELLGFANDAAVPGELNNYPVVCKLPELDHYVQMNDVKLIYALYKPELMKERTKLLRNLKIAQDRFFNFIHPTAFVSISARMGTGNVVLNNAVLSNSVVMGHNNIINAGVIIEHDSTMLDCNFLAAGCIIGANVKMGDGSFIGLNATVRESLQIKDYAFLGMGSVLTKNITEEKKWYGNPAKPN